MSCVSWKQGLPFTLLLCTVCSGVPGVAQHHRKLPHRTAHSLSGGPTGTVNAFERAYALKDKKTMIMKLMAPTQDAEALEKRYQWYRGYGPHDLPGTVHPPILFESSKGSFVPGHFTITSVIPQGADRCNVTVNEVGTYRDEDGRYNVNRNRLFRLQKLNGKWYVADYVLKENQEDYGFYADDIYDKMTKVGK